MELLVFGYSGASVLFPPTLNARFYDYENWGVLKSLEPIIDAGQLQVICVNSVDKYSFYCEYKNADEKLCKHLQHETYILKEVIPFFDNQNPNSYKIVAGCIMATNSAKKYLEKGMHSIELESRSANENMNINVN